MPIFNLSNRLLPVVYMPLRLFMEFIDSGLFWLVIGGMLLLMGLATPGLVLFFFAVGATSVAALNWLYPVNMVWQLVIFLLLSLFLLGSYRKIFKGSFFAGDEVDEVVVEVGARGEVVALIAPPAVGRVKILDHVWQATADIFIEEGQTVYVVRRDGPVLHVGK
ncbi:unknown protein [Desulfotalea psychrophila LSv54]|uniref:NfeD-like C-terminal domain-containing protein n=2 Tax=Desulfotalea psychrophila TaxID=84980 RepID=Q6AS06_DESPS|nr:unknown protein [Desulfotalea psychrophila LSv54]